MLEFSIFSENCLWHKLAAATLLHKLITLKLVNCMWPKFGAIKYAFLLLYHGSSCIPLIVYRLHQFIVGTGCILIYLIIMNIICSLCHALYMYNWTKPVNIRDIPWTAPASIFVYRVFLDCILSEKLAHSTQFPSSFVIHNNHISFMLISGQALLHFCFTNIYFWVQICWCCVCRCMLEGS